jgi:hypothetical protein
MVCKGEPREPLVYNFLLRRGSEAGMDRLSTKKFTPTSIVDSSPEHDRDAIKITMIIGRSFLRQPWLSVMANPHLWR